MGGPPKPGPASPANMSKRGLSARLYDPNQTLIMVNGRLPQENLVRGKCREPKPLGGPGSAFRGGQKSNPSVIRQRPDRVAGDDNRDMTSHSRGAIFARAV